MSWHGSILVVSAGSSSVGLDLARFGLARLGSGLVQPSWPETFRGEPSFVSTSLQGFGRPGHFFTLSPGTFPPSLRAPKTRILDGRCCKKHARMEVQSMPAQRPTHVSALLGLDLGLAQARFGLRSGSCGLGSARVWLGWLSTQLGPAWPDKARRASAHPVPAHLGYWFPTP